MKLRTGLLIALFACVGIGLAFIPFFAPIAVALSGIGIGLSVAVPVVAVVFGAIGAALGSWLAKVLNQRDDKHQLQQAQRQVVEAFDVPGVETLSDELKANGAEVLNQPDNERQLQQAQHQVSEALSNGVEEDHQSFNEKGTGKPIVVDTKGGNTTTF